jgi:hypothetical protein
MAGWTRKATLLSALAVVLCAPLRPQDTKSITVRILDGRTGHPIAPTGFQVRIDHLKAVHGDWVKPNEDGSGELSLPLDAALITMHFSYDSNMTVYVNCDAVNKKDMIGDPWYSVLDILDKGIVAPNECVTPKHAAKLKMPEAKPGEIVLFVRPKNWHELGID